MAEKLPKVVNKPKKVRQQEAKKVKEIVEDMSSESEMSDLEVRAVSNYQRTVCNIIFIKIATL